MGEKTMYIYGNDVRFGFSKELISKSKVFIYIYIYIIFLTSIIWCSNKFHYGDIINILRWFLIKIVCKRKDDSYYVNHLVLRTSIQRTTSPPLQQTLLKCTWLYIYPIIDIYIYMYFLTHAIVFLTNINSKHKAFILCKLFCYSHTNNINTEPNFSITIQLFSNFPTLQFRVLIKVPTTFRYFVS